MSASDSGKRAVFSTAITNELRTPLMAGTLQPLPPTPQVKEVQIDNAGGDDPGNNNIAVATTLIQMVKILKIHKPDFYYNNWDKLKK